MEILRAERGTKLCGDAIDALEACVSERAAAA